MEKAGTLKTFRTIASPMRPDVEMESLGHVLVLSANNYLGLADHPEVVRAGKEALDTYGAGTASGRSERRRRGTVCRPRAAVKLYDLTRKREAEAVHLQAQISDALPREPALFAVPVTATADVPLWSGTPATIVLSGQVPSRELHDAVLRIVRQESARIRPDVVITDRIVVDPSMAVRAA